jgi:putative hydrolase of the HAD superfamily
VKSGRAAKKKPPTVPPAPEGDLANPPESIEAVIFDFGGVLCAHPEEHRFIPMAELLNADPRKFRQAFWHHRIPYDAGLESEEYWALVADHLGCDWNRDLLPKLVEYEVDLWNHFDDQVLEFAAHLQARGYGTAILSNLPRPLGERLRVIPGFLNAFDHHTFSFELNMVKPDPAIYRHAIEGLGVAPHQALFLDDKPENVEGARKAGLFGELYEEWGLFEEEVAPRYGLPLPGVARRQ